MLHTFAMIPDIDWDTNVASLILSLLITISIDEFPLDCRKVHNFYDNRQETKTSAVNFR